MRPQSIKYFDYLYLGSIALGVLSFLLNYNAIAAEIDRETAETGVQIGSGLAMGSLIFSVIVSLALWFLISRLRIEFVKWILIVFFFVGLIGIPTVFAQLPNLQAILSLIATVLQALAIYFLFQPDAKAWFAEKRGDPVD